jgi:hypothetical protein
MKSLRLTTVCIAALVCASIALAGELAPEDKQFLDAYVKVGAALTADNLAAAKEAAAQLGENGAALAQSDKITTARTEFEKLSGRAIELGGGRDGYYVVNCPMLRKDWLQPAGKIANPYAGGTMPECGAIRKQPKRE